MTTPDGISSDDWDLVHELAVGIANAANEQEAACERYRLLEWLDELERKYGSAPSILAARADFIGNVENKRDLLLRAHSLAEERHDMRNALYVAHSLAELYLEEFQNAVEGRRWLQRVEDHLVQVDDGWFAEEYERLRAMADELSQPGT